MSGMPGTRAYNAAGELLRLLAAPARLAIVAGLSERPRRVGELVELLGMSQPLVSQHLRVLRDARLVVAERQGREIVYTLVDQHVGHIVADAVRHADEEPGIWAAAVEGRAADKAAGDEAR